MKFPHSYPIVGSYYRPPAKALLSSLPVGTRLLLRPDPNGEPTGSNHDDPTAISVHVRIEDFPSRDNERFWETLEDRVLSAGWALSDILARDEFHLGYIPAVVAKKLSPLPRDEIPGELLMDISGNGFRIGFNLN